MRVTVMHKFFYRAVLIWTILSLFPFDLVHGQDQRIIIRGG